MVQPDSEWKMAILSIWTPVGWMLNSIKRLNCSCFIKKLLIRIQLKGFFFLGGFWEKRIEPWIL